MVDGKLQRLSHTLRAANISHLLSPSGDRQLEDDEIIVTPTIHVQVGRGYVCIVRTLRCGKSKICSATEKRLVEAIQRELQLEAEEIAIADSVRGVILDA
jgi:hypothetical protein